MLLIHQSGSVKVGEVVRYTVTYTPSNDRILPTPSHLHLRVRNTCAIPLRAAWIHGPYALHVAAYPGTFNPHNKVENPEHDGVPQYEPMLKAGGSWHAKLKIPDDIRQDGADMARRGSISSTDRGRVEVSAGKSVTWILDIASQILFSTSASIDFEVLLGRDERSLELGFAAVAGHGHGGPGKLQDVDGNATQSPRRRHRQNVGVYSKAIRLVVEDTEALWNKPELPSWGKHDHNAGDKSNDGIPSSHHKHQEKVETQAKIPQEKPLKQKKIHLVVATHGLHSNIGADMLFLKESIDATVKQAREETKKRRQSYRDTRQGEPSNNSQQESHESSTAPLSGGQEDLNPDDDDEEQTIVRGFTGNAVKTENGIQYLGKRLAKYILRLTYPDQPFMPVKKSFSRSFTDNFRSAGQKANRDGQPVHHGSSVHLQDEQPESVEERAYRFTSISFVGHSLGGLIQTYAIAYIHKHSPTFFERIEPINFITMAAPMLGLSNENPMYIKFALDFGLVGRTGQDLGLTWRPPTLAKGGWNAMLAGFSSNSQKEPKQEDPTAKPLLRILPSGPAHHVLRMFRNRTLYSNVVNDGIVPLRTSCLLFLDWRGLGKVVKARRENGLIGTMAEWGWAEITGANSSSITPNVIAEQQSIKSAEEDDEDEHVRKGEGDTVPQPSEDETAEDSKKFTNRVSFDDESDFNSGSGNSTPRDTQDKGMLDSLLGFFKGSPTSSTSPGFRSTSPHKRSSKKQIKALTRAQTVSARETEGDEVEDERETTSQNPTMRPRLHAYHTGQTKQQPRSKSSVSVEGLSELQPPPRTSIFESAGDVLHPPLPSTRWITDPSTRARTIFHDRVYHPDDIPPPPVKRQGTVLTRTFSGDNFGKNGDNGQNTNSAVGGMKIEEKIARAYHNNLSWRKVLVRLEPDAHNNMVVRRMFANAYGWPVIKHLCDTHFANTYTAQTRDEAEPARERAPPINAPIPEQGGEEVTGQTDKSIAEDNETDMRKPQDEMTDLERCPSNHHNPRSPLNREESAVWDDSILDGSDDDGSDVDERGFMQRLINPNSPRKISQSSVNKPSVKPFSLGGSTPVTPVDGHRGLTATSPVLQRAHVTLPDTPSPAVNLTGGPESPLLTSNSLQRPETAHVKPDSIAETKLRKSLERNISQD